MNVSTDLTSPDGNPTFVRATRPRDAARLPMLDVARLIAAVGVIAAHVLDEFFPGDPAWMFGSYAVPFYLFVALYFSFRGLAQDEDRRVGPYLLGRVKRLYVPFLLWNVIYDVFHVLRHRGEHLTPPWQTLWAAIYTHLYFLPFLLAVTLLVCPLVRPLLKRPTWFALTIIALVVAAAVIACSPQPTWLADTQKITHETLWNFYRAIPPACLAVCVALMLARRPAPRMSGAVAAVGVLLMVGCLSLQYHVGQQGLLRAGSGLGLAMVGFWGLNARWLTPMAALGRLSFGVYLSHVLVIRLVMSAVRHYGWPLDARVATLVGAVALVGGLLISMALASSPWTRWMIGCEPPSLRRRETCSSRETVSAATTAAA